MSRRGKRDILTGVEIGTKTIKALVGEFRDDDVLSVLGVVEQPSLGVRKGRIENDRQVASQLAQVFRELQSTAKQEITDNIFVAVTGGHVGTVVSSGAIRIRDPESGVTEDEMESVLDTAQTFSLGTQQELLHLCDRPIRLSNGREVVSPVGAQVAKIEAECMLVFGQGQVLDTTRDLLGHVLGDVPLRPVFSGVAAGLAALSPSDIEHGALVIDLGGGVTEYCVYKSPGCFHTGQVTVGCEHLVNDLHIGLKLESNECAAVLRDLPRYGSVILKDDGGKRRMPVGSGVVSKREVPVAAVEQIVDLRLRELFGVIRDDLLSHNALERVDRGIKLCGGGALLPGVERLAQDVFDHPVEVVGPRLVVGDRMQLLQSPRFVTPVGLLRLGRIMLAGEREDASPFWQQLRTECRRFFSLIKDVFRI
ncbi:MAG: cell division protein FtsA [Victivallales bacterium]|nr:cell division protein FtsA [Victivallales bacterium]MBT7298102.1 cell division protein FtsA [Victivallales bacterium]